MKSKTSTMVHRFINGLAPGELFAARQVIHMGPSKAIYDQLSYMAKTGRLMRMTYGIYLKPDRFGNTRMPTLEEIVALKLKVFDRLAITHDCQLVQEIDEYEISEANMAMSGFEIGGAPDEPLQCNHKDHVEQLDPNDPRALLIDVPVEINEAGELVAGPVELTTNFDLIYDIDSSSSSISTVRGIARFRRVSKRKMTLADTRVGRVIRGLWACGPKHVSERRIYKALESLGRGGREELGDTSARGPNWLRDCLGCWQFVRMNRKTA